MADATNEVRLWRCVYGTDNGAPPRVKWAVGERPAPALFLDRCDEYIARPRADDDAREERLKELRDWLAGANADLAYIDKAVVAAGYRFSTTEAQPEHVVEVAMFLASLKRDRDEWMARAEKAEAERDAANRVVRVAAQLGLAIGDGDSARVNRNLIELAKELKALSDERARGALR